MRYFCLLWLFLFLQVSSASNHVERALTYENINESKNSKTIYEFQKFVGIGKNASWCAAFVSYVTDGKPIKTALAKRFITSKSIKAKEVLQGRVKIPRGAIIIWSKGTTWMGHVGIVLNWNKGSGQTIEGNTSASNKGDQRNGNGVYKKNRKIEPYNYFRITHFTLI